MIGSVGIVVNADVEVKNWLIEGRCDDGFGWNPSACDKLCDVDEYLNYLNCKWKKRLIDKLVEQHSEDIAGKEINCNAALRDFGLNENARKSCMLYVILLIIAYTAIMVVSGASFYFYCWRNKIFFKAFFY